MAKKISAKPKPIDHVRMLECIRAIKEREQTIKELKEEVTSYKTEIQEVMTAHKLEEMLCDVFTVRFKDVITEKLDSTALKEQCRSIYDKFLKTTVSKRFTIN